MSVTETNWSRTAIQQVDLAPDRVWSILGDPERLPCWQPGWAAVHLHGAPAVGTTGEFVPAARLQAGVHRRFAERFTITELEPGRRLVIEQRQPGGRWRFEYRIDPTDSGCQVSQHHDYRGIGAGAVGAALGDDLADFDQRCVRLRGLAGGVPATSGLRVVIAGGTGLLGRHLAADLTCRGHQVVLLTRSEDADLPFVQRQWDGRTVREWADGLFDEPGRTAVVNLAGRIVGARPTAAAIREFTTSRVESTAALLQASRSASTPLAAWLQASTTAIWGDAGEQRCSERTPPPTGPGALPQMTGVATAWEAAFTDPPAHQWTVLRTSLVLARDAPIVHQLARFARLGLGGRMGSGDQWFSWIHLADWLSIARASLGLDPDCVLPNGVVVAASPHPERNAEVMRLVRRGWHRPAAPPTPRPLAVVGGWVMGTDPALGLTGRHATSTVLTEAGYTFAQPRLESALDELWT